MSNTTTPTPVADDTRGNHPSAPISEERAHRLCRELWAQHSRSHEIAFLVERLLENDELDELDWLVYDYETALDDADCAQRYPNADWTQRKTNRTLPDEGQSLREVCEFFGVDYIDYPLEVFQYWLVSDWFADQLEMHGAHVADVSGLRIWCRTTCGQSCWLDSCVRGIVDGWAKTPGLVERWEQRLGLAGGAA